MSAAATEKRIGDMVPADLARMALEASNNLSSDAVNWAERWLAEHPRWEEQFLPQMRRAWLTGHIGTYLQDQRKRCAAVSAQPFSADFRGTMERNYARMIDAPLWGGKRIGDATPAEIRESAAQFRLNGSAMIRKAAWQDAVADAAEKNGAGVNEPVSAALSPQKFEELWEASDAA